MIDVLAQLRTLEPKAIEVLAKAAVKGDRAALRRLQRHYPETADQMIAAAKKELSVAKKTDHLAQTNAIRRINGLQPLTPIKMKPSKSKGLRVKAKPVMNSRAMVRLRKTSEAITNGGQAPNQTQKKMPPRIT